MKKFLFLLLCSPLLLFSTSNTLLKEGFAKAQTGDYFVFLQNKNLILIHIFEAGTQKITVEEISAPATVKKKIHGDWQKWVKEGAPGHSAWVMYELDLGEKQLDQIYSFSQKNWQKVYPEEQIFPTLLNLKFEQVPEKRRKRVGPPPLPDMLDDRPLWQPPLFCHGKKVKGVTCQALEAHWPNDGTELANKKVEIFLPQENSMLPTYFPFWLQLSNKFASAKLHVIDSGRSMKSLHSSLPLPPPVILSSSYSRAGDLVFKLKVHPRMSNFNLFIRPAESSALSSISIPSQCQYDSVSKQLFITVLNEDLNNKLKLDKLYYFVFEPVENELLTIETPKPLGLIKKYATK